MIGYMPAGLLRHRLVRVVDVTTAPLDPDGEDRGHPATTATDSATYWGQIQPRDARERASVASDDVNIGTHVIYLEAAAIGVVDVDDRLRKDAVDPDPDLAGTYRITAIGNAAGMGHHLKVSAELVRP